MNEREIIEFLQQSTAGINNENIIMGIGDDCAVLKKDSKTSWLVTMDSLVEGIHFDLAWHSPEKLGRKSVGVNVSDVAAMGGRPLFVFMSLGLPHSFKSEWLHGFSQGISSACKENGCVLVGGDTVRTREGAMITITVIGEAETEQVVYRNGARPGDIVWTSGSLGMAAAGLALCQKKIDPIPGPCKPLVDAHLNPRPRVELGCLLAENRAVTAMMDLSDGLATDLSHLCKQSGVGAVIHADKLPIDSSLESAAALVGSDSLELALTGGEDYELLFTSTPTSRKQVLELAEKAALPVTEIGVVTDDAGVKLQRESGSSASSKNIDISYQGFDHFSQQKSD